MLTIDTTVILQNSFQVPKYYHYSVKLLFTFSNILTFQLIVQNEGYLILLTLVPCCLV